MIKTSRAKFVSRLPLHWKPLRLELAAVAPRSKGLQARSVAAGMVVAAFACVTAWAATTVSMGLVIAYLVILAVIYLAPDRSRPAISLQPGESTTTEIRQGNSVLIAHNPVSESREVVNEPAASLDAESSKDMAEENDAPGADAALPRSRRGRVRARKLARPVEASNQGTPAVSWIRVGPGRFVRADAGESLPAAAHATASDSTIHDPPVTEDQSSDLFIESAPADPIEPLEIGESSELVGHSLEPVDVVGGCPERPIAREYGNAPSASESHPHIDSIESPPHDLDDWDPLIIASESPGPAATTISVGLTAHRPLQLDRQTPLAWGDSAPPPGRSVGLRGWMTSRSVVCYRNRSPPVLLGSSRPSAAATPNRAGRPRFVWGNTRASRAVAQPSAILGVIDIRESASRRRSYRIDSGSRQPGDRLHGSARFRQARRPEPASCFAAGESW